ncbi:MAG: ABC transporter permease [Bacteroidetes bacterium]|nr:ABC transporter permease [Bacteroidota bacterium]
MIQTLIIGLRDGFILVPLALGVFISYRLLRVADMTVDGTFVLGGMVTAVLLRDAAGPIVAITAAMLAGAVAGTVTGLLNTRLGVKRILAGILVMTALYSVNSSIVEVWRPSVRPEESLRGVAGQLTELLYGSTDAHQLFGMKFLPEHFMSLLLYAAVAVLAAILLLFFFHTRMGLAVRGAGSNDKAVRALGANVPVLVTVALALANGLAALSGALFVQEFEGIDIKDGIGSIVTGLACVMIGHAVSARMRFSFQLLSAVAGALLYKLLISALVSNEFLSSDVKLYTAIIVLLAMMLPVWLRRGRSGPEVTEV